jgi:mono/diheme cytochrome c family protein
MKVGAMLSRIAQTNIARAMPPRKHGVISLAGMLSGCFHWVLGFRPEPRKHGTHPKVPSPPTSVARCMGEHRFAPGHLVTVALVACLLSGCQQKMAVQPSYKPLDPSDFFPDGRSARPLVAGTVARGHLRTDLPLFTGKRFRENRSLAQPIAVVGTGSTGIGGAFITLAIQVWEYANDVNTFPLPVTSAVLEQGRSRYTIYCVVCHDSLGTGRGKIVERGYTPPPSYHIERLRQAPVGHFFDVITNGYGSMPDYREQVPPLDRWAIIAYIRALQLSQHYPEKELTGDMRQEWTRRGTLAKEGGAP